jgi:hypothetical protein
MIIGKEDEGGEAILKIYLFIITLVSFTISLLHIVLIAH